MAIIRSVTTKQSNSPDIEYRVGLHRPMKSKVGTAGLEPDPENPPYPVVEMYHRNDKGEWSMLATSKLDDFIELNRDVVRIANELTTAELEATLAQAAGDGEAVS